MNKISLSLNLLCNGKNKDITIQDLKNEMIHLKKEIKRLHGENKKHENEIKNVKPNVNIYDNAITQEECENLLPSSDNINNNNNNKIMNKVTDKNQMGILNKLKKRFYL